LGQIFAHTLNKINKALEKGTIIYDIT